MLINNLKITFRTFRANKTHVLINVLGLGITLACCLIAYMGYADYRDFNRIYRDVENVYQVNSTRIVEGQKQYWGVTPLALGPAARAEIPGIKASARFTYGYVSLRYEADIRGIQVAYLDPDFLQMFDLSFKYGTRQAINEPDQVIISEDLASLYFGDEYPIGKQVLLSFPQGQEKLMSIGAVLADIPDNTSFRLDLLLSYQFLMDLEGWDNSEWSYWQQPVNFCQLYHPENVPLIENELQRYISPQNAARPNWMVNRFYLQRFQDVAHNSVQFEEVGLAIAPPFSAIRNLIGLAGLILLIACFNFTNTTIALSGNRLKEIGVRKIMGAQRSGLVRQFLSECLILCFFAFGAGMIMTELLSGQLYRLGLNFQTPSTMMWDWRLWLFLAGLLLVTGLIAGSYPALYISSFKPVNLFSGKSKFRGNNNFTRVLLTIQFSASILAIIIGVIFTQNARYQEKISLGFNAGGVISINIPNNAQVYDVFSQTIRENPKIKKVSYSGEQLGVWAYTAILKESQQAETEHNVYTINVGDNYLETMGVEIIDGRSFDPNRSTDYETTAIINETLRRDLGWDQADVIGRQVISDARHYTIIGVAKDFKQMGLRAAIPPVIMHAIQPGQRMFSMVVRVEAEDLTEVFTYLEDKWYATFPNVPFNASYLEDVVRRYDRYYNRQISSIFLFLAVIATVLSASGLFALVSLRILARTKEIGVRKVLGASVVMLIRIISKEFLIILAIAGGLGTGLGYFLGDQMLTSMFAYRIDLNPLAFFVALLVISLTSIGTVGYKVVTAAQANPVDTLRTE